MEYDKLQMYNCNSFSFQILSKTWHSTRYCGPLPCEPESRLLPAILCFDHAQMIIMWPTLHLLFYTCMHIFYPILSIVVLVLMLLNKTNQKIVVILLMWQSSVRFFLLSDGFKILFVDRSLNYH